METLNFKVGDRVRVKSLEWYDSNKDVNGDIYNNAELNVFVRDMAQYCGKVLNITKLNCDSYIVEGNIYYWLDWMLEDEPVTEEKQEEKLKTNNMETKKMTLQEAQVFLEGTKFICKSKEERDNVLSKIKTLGVGVMDMKANSAYMFTIDNDNYLRHTISIADWIEFKDTVIEPGEILAIQIKENPKPKFDPNTLQPFDKVLVREEGKQWLARFFDIYEGGYNVTSGHSWTYCIPYNEETKHLHGTCDEAPEFYKLD